MTSSIISDRSPWALRWGVTGFLAVSLVASAATAQPTQGDPVAAQALFKAARALVDAGDWTAGCAKFEASLALQGSASTMLNIAKCHEHNGKIASAWDAYNRAQTLNAETKGADRRKGLDALAQKGIDALTPRLPKLRIVIEQPPPGLRVLRDGKEIPAGALGDALPADPGKHDIEVSAPGRRTEARSVTLEEGKTVTASFALAAGPDTSPRPEPTSRGHVPVWAWIAGAGGLALSGAAVFFLVDDLAAVHALRSPANCVPLASGGGYACDPTYDYRADNARKDRDFPLAVGLGAVGLAALGAGIGGIVTGLSGKGPDPAAVTALPWIAPGSAGASLRGRF